MWVEAESSYFALPIQVDGSHLGKCSSMSNFGFLLRLILLLIFPSSRWNLGSKRKRYDLKAFGSGLIFMLPPSFNSLSELASLGADFGGDRASPLTSGWYQFLPLESEPPLAYTSHLLELQRGFCCRQTALCNKVCAEHYTVSPQCLWDILFQDPLRISKSINVQIPLKSHSIFDGKHMGIHTSHL